MGKFGKNTLPKFLVKKYGNQPIRIDEESDPASNVMYDTGMLPKLEKLTEPKFIKELNKEDLASEGIEVERIPSNEVWALVKTVRGTNEILHFYAEMTDRDDDHGEYGHGIFSATKDGWEYEFESEFYFPHHAARLEVTDMQPETLSAKPTQEPDNQENITERKMKKSQRVIESFEQFNQHEVNEEDMIKEPEDMVEEPCEGCDHSDTLSEKAKEAIRKMCNEVLIHEAHLYESSENPEQTYEAFLKESYHYLAECLIRAAQNLKV